MRSRYTAYVKVAVPHVMKSSHPELRATLDEKATETWAKGSQWHKLEILSTDKGRQSDSEGTVEFACEYSDKGTRHRLHERAKFVKMDDSWYYRDGDIVPPQPFIRQEPKVGRNDPCPCGSGKKYKKCHALIDE